MPFHVQRERQHRLPRAARRVPRPAVKPRVAASLELPLPRQDTPAISSPSSSWDGFQADPYVDYARSLTEEGGVLITYKDFDLRLRHTLWRLFAWTTSTGIESWYALHHSPVHSGWINIVCLVAVAIANWLIVAKRVEVYRTVEMRPDCLIIDGADIFWRRHMEAGWPAFRERQDGGRVLCGIYGTRFVEYLTVPRFDEHDRTPEVFAAHLKDAIGQLWMRPFS